MFRIIPELIPSVEDAQVIDRLNITLLDVEPQCVFFSQEVESIQNLGLGFSDRGDFCETWEAEEICKQPTGVWDDDLRVVAEQHRAQSICRLATQLEVDKRAA